MSEPSIFDISSPGRKAALLPACDVPEKPVDDLLPGWAQRSAPAELPEASEIDIVRHFTRMSILNHHVDKGLYPLGSCTMKYNPKVNEAACRVPGLGEIHPEAPEKLSQGALRMMYELRGYLQEISGLASVTLQPAAGAQGELTGMLVVRAYHNARGNSRSKVIIPDSAHGTNPASLAIAGFSPVVLKSSANGLVDIEELESLVDDDTAALMITNPNTLGLFEKNISKVSKILHAKDALVYMDGANLNALVGRARPGDMGVDIMHFNLHKTFSTPHGGGGPGAGPVGVRKDLARFLPRPSIEKNDSGYYLDYDRPDSIGRLHGFFGNFGVLVRAYTYIRVHGLAGLRNNTEMAVLNANYIRKRLEGVFELPYTGDCFHECVFSGNAQKKLGVRTLDIAKRLLDYGFHAPTIYFPLIVPEALMIEPTETESIETLDAFCDAMLAIAKEAAENPELVTNSPHSTPVGRLNEGRAARELNVCCPIPGMEDALAE